MKYTIEITSPDRKLTAQEIREMLDLGFYHKYTLKGVAMRQTISVREES